MLRKTYDWAMSLAASHHAPRALAAVAFCEGLFFPIPPDVFLMPIVLQKREHAMRYAAITVVCSLAGGSCGFAVGHFLQPVGAWILSLTGGDLHAFQKWYSQYGLVLIAVPIPYKLTAIASGFGQVVYWQFLLVSLLVRGLRFGGEALLLKIYGPPIQAFVEKRLGLVTGGMALAVVALVLLLKFAHH
jgi:membrane protein YqaA with SNARE-associated domain